MRGKITKRIVDTLGSGKTDAFLWDMDVKGFGLKITPSGRKVYVLQYRFNGRLKRYTIGRHGSPWTPDSARKEAGRLLGLVADNKDPAESRAAAKAEITVAELCDLYLAEGCATKKASTISMDKSRIKRHIKPLLGKMRISTVTKADVSRFMQDIAAGKTARDAKTKKRGRSIVKGGKGAATRTVGQLGAIFTFAVELGLRPDNPVHGVKRYPDNKNERFLSLEELASVGKALSAAEQDDVNPYAIAAIRLLALTGCRKAEILSLKWDFLDLSRSCLRLPDSKTGAKVVPLGAPAVQLLSSIPRIENSPFVFPSNSPDRHFTGLQKVWGSIRETAELPGLRLHDLRHSFAAVGVASGDSLIVIGALLGHKTASATSRYAHLSDSPVQNAANRIAGNIAAAMNGGDEGGAEVLRIKNR